MPLHYILFSRACGLNHLVVGAVFGVDKAFAEVVCEVVDDNSLLVAEELFVI